MDGYQAGLHAPKVGCWLCLELFLQVVEEFVEEDGRCPHPDGPAVLAAFRAYAAERRVEHGAMGPDGTLH